MKEPPLRFQAPERPPGMSWEDYRAKATRIAVMRDAQYKERQIERDRFIIWSIALFLLTMGAVACAPRMIVWIESIEMFQDFLAPPTPLE